MNNNKFQRLNSYASILIQLARQKDLFDPYLRGYLNGLITMTNAYQNNIIELITEDDVIYQKLKGGD